MANHGSFKFRIPMTPANQHVLKRVTDTNDCRRSKTIWEPLLTDNVLPLLSHEKMGIHNVREPKTNTYVMHGVRESLEQNPIDFWLNHNGFVYVADSVRHIDDSKTKLKWLEFTFNFDEGYQGCLNGNSSRVTILEAIESGLMEKYDETGLRPQLSISIYTGLTHEEQLALGIGRNEQFAVSDSTVANANGLYDGIKMVLKGTKLENLISYKQNEIKPIHIDKVVQTLVALDNIGFPDSESNPIMAYVSRTSPRNYFEAHPDRMNRLYRRLPDFLKLRDIIARDFVEYYKSHPRASDTRRIHEISVRGEIVKVPTFFKYTGISEKNVLLPVLAPATSDTYIPDAMLMPVLSAFRAILTTDEGRYAEWTIKGGMTGVLKVWEKLGPSIVRKAVQAASQFGTPNVAGKSDMTWANCYEALVDGLDTLTI